MSFCSRAAASALFAHSPSSYRTSSTMARADTKCNRFFFSFLTSLRFQVQIHLHGHKRDQPAVRNFHAASALLRTLHEAARHPQKLLLVAILRKQRNIRAFVDR